jgi:hypothetical protein
MQAEQRRIRRINDAANSPKGEDSLRGQHSETLEKVTGFLNTDDGLLNELRVVSVSTDRQYNEVRNA